MNDDRSTTYRISASEAIESAEWILNDLSDGKLVDRRNQNRRQFDAMFDLMKSILLQLERIGDQLEQGSVAKRDPNEAI